MSKPTPSSSNETRSPFHRGEQSVQSRLGVREQMERFGQQVIRDHMPEQHRDFFHQLPFILVGHADKAGQPWASILSNPPGFIRSSESQRLEIHAQPLAGDPLADNLQAGQKLGLLGIELSTRRRNRLNATIVTNPPDKTADAIHLTVDQSFGNCPQYIQAREFNYPEHANQSRPKVEKLTTLDSRAQALIENSDTFFVASFVNQHTGHPSDGADVSHRGGKPGFVRVDNEQLLTIPDYLGNFHFNTLGNFIENPRAGVLFIDFEHGHLLSLTGRVEILWDSPDTQFFEGAERLWQFHLEAGYFLEHALPMRAKHVEYSANTLLTGSWPEAQALQLAEQQKHQWLPFIIRRIESESSVIRSFYLEADDHHPARFRPGQFLTLKAEIAGGEHIRTYSLSSAPGDPLYRISVKHQRGADKQQPDGVFSGFLHRQLKVGDVLEAKAAQGTFTFDSATERPAILLAGGVGITPMISMLRHNLFEGFRTRSMRQITLIGVARDQHQRAFFNEVQQLCEQSGGAMRSAWVLSKPDGELKPGKDYHHQGHLSAEFLQGLLALDDYEVYLCGPSGFMQSCYNLLRHLGINDCRIHAEAFGPASLQRDSDQASTVFEARPTASEAIVTFTDSKLEQAWTPAAGNLLAFAEAHGLQPDYGCRSGQCGACKATLVSGQIAYQTEPSLALADDEVLLCCAQPAASDSPQISRVAIKL